MFTRRTFIIQAAASGLLATAPFKRLCASVSEPNSNLNRVKGARRIDDTTLRLGGDGDSYQMSWASDDQQYVSVCDGVGWVPRPRKYNSHLWAIVGGPQDATFRDVPGYPNLIPAPSTDLPSYYSFGTLARNGWIYQYLSTLDQRYTSDVRNLRWIGTKIIYSPDNGRTWCNQDGSTPVIWEPWGGRSRKNMVFYEEPQNAFSLLSVLQMGRNYEANRDGYVYVYSPNGNTEGTMNQLVMYRVPAAGILVRGAYEFFAGLGPNGNPAWTKDIGARAIVYTFPSGWVSNAKGENPWGWFPSVTYNVPLGLYMMVGFGTGCTPEGGWFGKPSYLGIWIAEAPWGPWRQILEETAWTPGNDPGARAYSPQISPKWIAEDGKSFWIVWSDFQTIGDQSEPARIAKEYEQAKNPEEMTRLYMKAHDCQPYYSFNTQRVDLIVD